MLQLLRCKLNNPPENKGMIAEKATLAQGPYKS